MGSVPWSSVILPQMDSSREMWLGKLSLERQERLVLAITGKYGMR